MTAFYTIDIHHAALLLIYLTMLTYHQVAFSFYWGNGVTPSDPRPFIGENLSLTCEASMRRKKNYSSYLYFEHNQMPVQPQYVHIINKRSIGLTLPILRLEDEGQFVCWYNRSHKMPLTIGHQFVDVDYRPVKVEKIDCVVFNWQNMTCSWKLNRVYRYPKRIRVTAFWRISQEPENGAMKACPSGNSNSTSCSWPSIIENYFFHPDVTYIIAVEVASTVRDVKETSELFVIDTRALVKPAPLESFRISQKNSTYLCLAWNHSDSHHSKMVEVQYKTDNGHWENQTTNGGQTCIGDLIPNTMYTLRGAVWPLVNYLPTGYPSEWINITEGTQQSALEVAPDMCDGCFTVLDTSTSRCHVIIYWKHIPRELQYTELRGYQVHIENGTQVLQSYNRSKSSAFLCLNISLDQSLTVTLLAMTDRTEWSLTYSTLVLPAYTQQPASPEDFIVETDVAVTFNVTFYLKWTSPESDTAGYTVFWCLGRKETKTCYENETLNWKHLPENITNYNLTIKGKKDEYLVGLSRQVSKPGTKTLSSGISWSQCFYLRDIEPLKSPGKPVAKYTLSEKSLLVWWSPLSCTESGSFIKHYVVYYSIANSTKPAESVKVDRTRHSVKLYSLQTGRRYAIQIAAASDKGFGAKSEIIFIDVPEGEDNYAKPHSFILIVCTVLGLSIGATVMVICVCILNDLFQEKLAKFAQNENRLILSHVAKTFTHSRNFKPSRQIYHSVGSISRTTQSSVVFSECSNVNEQFSTKHLASTESHTLLPESSDNSINIHINIQQTMSTTSLQQDGHLSNSAALQPELSSSLTVNDSGAESDDLNYGPLLPVMTFNPKVTSTASGDKECCISETAIFRPARYSYVHMICSRKTTNDLRYSSQYNGETGDVLELDKSETDDVWELDKIETGDVWESGKSKTGDHWVSDKNNTGNVWESDKTKTGDVWETDKSKASHSWESHSAKAAEAESAPYISKQAWESHKNKIPTFDMPPNLPSLPFSSVSQSASYIRISMDYPTKSI